MDGAGSHGSQRDGGVVRVEGMRRVSVSPAWWGVEAGAASAELLRGAPPGVGAGRGGAGWHPRPRPGPGPGRGGWGWSCGWRAEGAAG